MGKKFVPFRELSITAGRETGMKVKIKAENTPALLSLWCTLGNVISEKTGFAPGELALMFVKSSDYVKRELMRDGGATSIDL